MGCIDSSLNGRICRSPRGTVLNDPRRIDIDSKSDKVIGVKRTSSIIYFIVVWRKIAVGVGLIRIRTRVGRRYWRCYKSCSNSSLSAMFLSISGDETIVEFDPEARGHELTLSLDPPVQRDSLALELTSRVTGEFVVEGVKVVWRET